MTSATGLDFTSKILFSDLTRDWIPPLQEDALQILSFHQNLSGYERTPLHPLPSIAQLLGVKAVYLKDEGLRFGLPSFKFLGVSWAAFRLLCARLGLPTTTDVPTLRRALGGTVLDGGAAADGGDRVTLVAATDGYHGRVVSRIARLFGTTARVFVARGSSWELYNDVWQEGAVISEVDGDYAAVVAAAKAFAVDHDNVLFVDHDASPGYENMPKVRPFPA